MILFLSDVAGSEVLLILVFVLMFFGSKSIPGIAKTLGKTMRQIKDASDELQNEIKKSGMDIKKDLNLDNLNLDSFIKEANDEIEKPFQEQARELHASINFDPPRNFNAPVDPPEIANTEEKPNTIASVEEPVEIPTKEISELAEKEKAIEKE